MTSATRMDDHLEQQVRDGRGRAFRFCPIEFAGEKSVRDSVVLRTCGR